MAEFLFSTILGSPIRLALVASFLFGAMVVCAKLGLRYMDAYTAARFSVAVTWLFFMGLAPFSLAPRDFLSPVVLVFAGIGLVQPFMSMFLSFEATQRMGPTVSATVSSTSPLFATEGALLLLGESLTPPVFLGTVGVVIGVIVLSWESKARRDWQAAALLFAIGAAMIRGFANIGHRYAMEILPLPVMAGLVSYTVSFSLGWLLYAVNPHRRPLRIPWRGAKWLMAAGVGNGTAMLAMIAALRDGPVVVVIPIVGSFPLFTLLTSLLLFRQERLTLRILAGLLLIVASVSAISLVR